VPLSPQELLRFIEREKLDFCEVSMFLRGGSCTAGLVRMVKLKEMTADQARAVKALYEAFPGVLSFRLFSTVNDGVIAPDRAELVSMIGV
jgi:hypothetical protein